MTLRPLVRAVSPPRAAAALRLSLAFVFITFGGIKLWPASPADDLVRNGVFFVPHDVFFPVLGLWEVLIGVALLHPRLVRPAVYLLIPQIAGTQLPLLTLTGWTWHRFPVVPTEIGAYILKNWVLLSAGFVVLATVQSDRVQSDRVVSHVSSRFERVGALDRYLSTWIERYGYAALRATLAGAFLWFGITTMLGVGSAARLLAEALSPIGPPGAIVVLYGALKVGVGLALLSKSTIRWGARLAAVYLLVSFVPLIVFPEHTFLVFPIAPSFEGVSVLKDLVLVSGVFWVAARTTRGA